MRGQIFAHSITISKAFPPNELIFQRIIPGYVLLYAVCRRTSFRLKVPCGAEHAASWPARMSRTGRLRGGGAREFHRAVSRWTANANYGLGSPQIDGTEGVCGIPNWIRYLFTLNHCELARPIGSFTWIGRSGVAAVARVSASMLAISRRAIPAGMTAFMIGLIRPGMMTGRQMRTCWQALYQASPPPSSAQEKRARGRS